MATSSNQKQKEKVTPVGEPVQFDTPQGDIMRENRVPYYMRCYWFGNNWRMAGQGSDAWPQGVQLWEDKMYLNCLLCVPTELTGRLIRAHHAIVGHVTGDRLRNEMSRRYMFVPSMKIPQIIAEVRNTYVVCQAHQYPNFQVHGPIAATPVGPELGISWSVYLFMMPALVWKSQAYHCMMV